MMTLEKYFEGKDHGLNLEFLLEAFKGIDYLITPMKDNIMGLATHNKVYLNSKNYCSDLFYYVALHELAHHKRMLRNGLQFHLDILSSTDFEEFSEHVIEEELIADRYATKLFKIANGYDSGYNQNLHKEVNKAFYKGRLRDNVFGTIKNDVEHYNKVVETYFV